MKKSTLLALIISTFVLHSIAQKVTNVKATQQDKTVIVSYKFEVGKTSRVYSPILYYSTDGGNNYNKCKSTKAKYAKPNQANQITWNVTNDLDYFGGSNIVFKVNTIKLPIVGKYKTVKIGNQVWMAENLNLDVGAECWCYGNIQSNCNKYGRLYTWEAAKRAANKIAGWHLPSDAEWKQLERYLGMSKSDADSKGWRGNIGKKLQSTSGWKTSSSGNGNNSSGFSAMPGGEDALTRIGHFQLLGSFAYFWTATRDNNYRAVNRSLSGSKGVERSGSIIEDCAFSVRLVRD